MNTSPYNGKSKDQWKGITTKLIEQHPLDRQDIVNTVLTSWDNIFKSSIGKHSFRFGINIFPKPQIMGFLLHELIPLEFAANHPSEWRGEKTAADKDIEYIKDHKYSIELKCSSHKNQIFGNRSYAQKPSHDKKSKNGFYLTINFEKFETTIPHPKIILIRFGWLDHTDWIGQTSATGQQARLTPETYDKKFEVLYSKR
jgi:hypothetical protein